MIYSDVNLLEVILCSGFWGILIWLFLFLASIVGIVLGIKAIFEKAEPDTYPLAFKLLTVCIITTLLLGYAGTLFATIDTFSGGSPGSAEERARVLRFFLSLSKISFLVGLISALAQSIMLVVSWVLIRHRRTQRDAVLVSIRKTRALVYLAILFSVPVVFCAGYSIQSIEEILLLEPGKTMPFVWGVPASSILMVCLLFGLGGVLSLLAALTRTVIDLRVADDGT